MLRICRDTDGPGVELVTIGTGPRHDPGRPFPGPARRPGGPVTGRLGRTDQAHQRETECGDRYAATRADAVVTGVLCDGLGHGPLAAVAAQQRSAPCARRRWSPALR